MRGVTKMFSELPVSKAVDQATREFDKALCQAINRAKADGVPLGFIVALLHGHDVQQTALMNTTVAD